MLKIAFIVVGKTKSSFLKEGIAFYRSRLENYTPVEWMEVREVPVRKGIQEKTVIEKEGQAILNRCSGKDRIIALDRKGRAFDSMGWASRIEQMQTSLSSGRIVFITGGPLGLSEEILNSASEIWSMSKLTLTHEMVRLFMLEQIYRAFTIIRHEKYHK
jgi:23S rRNA (pseudouridine1915-N3)-methyltransferase